MKINLLSDIHLEFAPHTDEVPKCDVVVLAGDICNFSDLATMRFLDMMKAINKAYVPRLLTVGGNHDHYLGMKSDVVGDCWVEEIAGVTFIGATMWSPVDEYAWLHMNDKSISGLTREDILKWHKKECDFIEQSLEANKGKRCVVVTHHMPSDVCIAPQYVGNLLNSGFVAAEFGEAMMDKYEPELWLHGHTHNSVDTVYNKTRIVCNPKGYPRVDGSPENTNFDSGLVIEI